jgi:hypothetical protein
MQRGYSPHPSVADYGGAVSFFERPAPPPPPPEEYRKQPAWIGPPDNVLGGAVALELILARTDDTVVIARNMVAYPNGLDFVLGVRKRRFDPHGFYDPLGRHPGPHRGEGIPDEILRFGIQLSDGSKATTVDHHRWPGPDERVSGPMLTPHGGGGGGGRWDMSFWLWPLPPTGPLAFVVEWPSEGILETRVEIDASLLRDAAARSEELWPEQGPQGGGATQTQPWIAGSD